MLVNNKNFNHLKVHTQYSICEGAIKIDDLKDKAKELKIKALGLCDTANLCGAIEFSDKLSKVGSQPIIGTQINFRFEDTIGLLPLFALDENGYKKIIELSSKSYLDNNEDTVKDILNNKLFDNLVYQPFAYQIQSDQRGNFLLIDLLHVGQMQFRHMHKAQKR